MAFAYTKIMQALGSVAAVATDAYFNLVTLLLPGNGTNGAQNNTFLDSSTNNFSITRNGNTTQGTFSPFSQTGWSNYFSGSQSLSNATSVTASGDFTLECWLRLDSYSAARIFFSVGNETTNRRAFFIDSSGVIKIDLISVGATSLGGVVPLNTWTHIAITRSGSTVTAYVNGIATGTTGTISGTFGNANGFYVGSVSDNSNSMVGYMSNLRWVLGSVVYTSNFTPPTSPLTSITNTSILTCQSSRFVDNSSNAYALTVNGTPSVQAFSPFAPTAAYSASTVGGSGYFDGSGDYLSFTDASNNLDLGGATDSLEFWLYPTASTAAFPLFTKNGGIADYNTTNGIEYTGGFNSAQFLMYYNTGGSFGTLTDSTTRPLNQWYHVVYASNSTNVSLFVNGTRTATVAATISKPTTRTAFRVAGDIGGNFATGYFSGFRFIQGSGAYDAGASTITVPTAPLTAITNTQLLLNFTNAGIVDSTAKNDLETVGNAQISTTQSKFGGSSMYFDGTGDWLLFPSSQTVAFGTGDFTIEFWYYTSTTSGFRGLFSTSSTDGETGTFRAYLNNANTGITMKVGTTDTNFTQTLTANAWVHLAFVRSGGTLAMYYNGTKNGTTASITNDILAKPLIIGANFIDGTEPFTGYFDDIRISKYARYTATFTPPTSAFPLQ